MKNKLLTLAFAILYICLQPCLGQGSDLLWKGVGGKEKWEQTTYILFTVNGNGSKYIQDGRRFLIHRSSGRARFEGRTEKGSNLVVLFNYKTGKLKKYYINGEEISSSSEIQESFNKVQEQFQRDNEFLFLSTKTELHQAKSKVSSRIVNAEKLLSIPIQLPHNNISGELLFHPETGWIKQISESNGGTYLVNGYKDIGGGIYLPT